MSALRGLLASPSHDGEAVKGLYFFAGEAAGNLHLYTTHPLLADDQHWNSDSSSRSRVMARMAASHANTVVMSYWGDMEQWSPMRLDATSLDATSLHGVLDAARGHGLVVMPAIESGVDRDHPELPQWEFRTDFPSSWPDGPRAPGLLARIGDLVHLFRDHMDVWAQMYDRDGRPRYAVQVIHACSALEGTTDRSFALAFAQVADLVQSQHQIAIGFTLDAIGGDEAYVAAPATAGPALEAQPAVMAIHGFQSEVFSGKVIAGDKFKPPKDNNVDNLENLARWKGEAARDWADTGLPVILDVSNGMDGRYVWRDRGSYFYGDNLDYTDDRWRNRMSLLKGHGNVGITFDTWNGYTEGYAAVTSFEHYDIVGRWVTDLLEPDPRELSHMHYVGGRATHRVYGAICDKWLSLGADEGFGIPTSEETTTEQGRVTFFTDTSTDPPTANKAIYWSPNTGPHEMHGIIAQTYWESADRARLGLPTVDQTATPAGAFSRFERGRIDWTQGDQLGRVTYD